MIDTKNLAPAYLFQGTSDIVLQQVESLAQYFFCVSEEKTNDCFCKECRKIKNNCHPFVLWLEPENDYSVKDIDVIFTKTLF